VNHLLKSVVREICTLRSVGTGGRATASGDPVCAVMRISTASTHEVDAGPGFWRTGLLSQVNGCADRVWATHAIAQPDQATRSTRNPALCPVRALPNGLPLTKVPSLHPLRRRSLGLVRGLPWYYARMCDFSRPCIIGYGSMPSR
jgi:hypothetical protein